MRRLVPTVHLTIAVLTAALAHGQPSDPGNSIPIDSGPRDLQADLEELLQTHQSTLRTCDERAFLRNPTHSGEFVVDIEVARDGTVANATAIRTTIDDETLQRCHLIRTMRFQFSPSPGACLEHVHHTHSVTPPPLDQLPAPRVVFRPRPGDLASSFLSRAITADALFDAYDTEEALAEYRVVRDQATAASDQPMALFASYRMAWCEFRLGHDIEAVERMKSVVLELEQMEPREQSSMVDNMPTLLEELIWFATGGSTPAAPASNGR
jgi:hypothetical protein